MSATAVSFYAYKGGVGRTMMSRALEICARSLFKHVMLSVRPDERAAIDLYGRFGFRRIGQMIAYRPPST